MDKVVRESVSDVDAVVLVVEPIASVGRQEAELIRQIRNSGVPPCWPSTRLTRLRSQSS